MIDLMPHTMPTIDQRVVLNIDAVALRHGAMWDVLGWDAGEKEVCRGGGDSQEKNWSKRLIGSSDEYLWAFIFTHATCRTIIF